jgi:hypothetical protein
MVKLNTPECLIELLTNHKRKRETDVKLVWTAEVAAIDFNRHPMIFIFSRRAIAAGVSARKVRWGGG